VLNLNVGTSPTKKHNKKTLYTMPFVGRKENKIMHYLLINGFGLF